MIKCIYQLTKSLAPVLILILISTACSARGTEQVRETTPTAPPDQVATETATPTAIEEPVSSPTTISTPAPEPTSQPGLLYQDDFTQLDSGWSSIDFDNSYIGYHEPEYYHVEVHAPNSKEVVRVPDQNLDDFTAEVEVFPELGITAAEGDFRYGLFFRRAGEQYYAFTISPRTKTWFVLKSSPTGLEVLEAGQDDSIQGMETADTLRVDARDSSFFFHINGKSVGQVNDVDYTSGEVGMYVQTFDSPQAHIHYDLLTIWVVQAPELSCRVITEALNLRSGPGTRFGGFTALELGAKFEPLERNPDGLWIRVRLEDSDQSGWVSSLPKFVACNVSVEDLPVAEPD